MIAVDTNVLLRRLLNDDATQAEKARRLFETQESVLVTDVVLAETIWTLTGKRYGAGKEELAAVVMGLLEERNVVFESRQAVWSALNDYLDALPVKTASGVRTADLADALVVNKAKITAQQRNEPYRGTYTYDQAALASKERRRLDAERQGRRLLGLSARRSLRRCLSSVGRRSVRKGVASQWRTAVAARGSVSSSVKSACGLRRLAP